ncbi:hypothetical protein [Octadecabacter sp. R77987]|uniref:hypothetical protein n=1 Tax=Octadecabacter sp. R77987 TaxID=3093874 RepID=UPI00366E147A
MASTNNSCKTWCWVIGAILGLLAFFWANGQWPFIVALLIGIIVGVGLAWLLATFFCKGSAVSTSAGAGTAGASAPSATPPTAAPTKPAALATGGAATTSATTAMPSVPATPKADAKPKAAAKPATAKAAKPAAKPAAKASKPAAKTAKPAAKAAKPAAKAAKPAAAKGAKPAAKPAAAKAAKPAAAKPAAAKPARKPVAADGKPETLTKARAGGADDLKMLKGVGPGLEKTLNELGFYHFDQVASWRKQEVEWVDSRLKFKGRIERDEWIKQAKTLAKGGKTAFSEKAKKEGTYKK